MTKVVITDQSGLDQLYASVARDFADTSYTAYLHDVLRRLAKLHKQYFDAEQNPIGAAWPALAPSTIARKGHSTILFESGRLKASLTQGTGDSVADVFQEGSNAGMTFGTTVPYSIFHDRATDNRPARRHVGIDAKVLDSIAQGAVDVALARLKPVA